jgi:hypothetical protein
VSRDHQVHHLCQQHQQEQQLLQQQRQLQQQMMCFGLDRLAALGWDCCCLGWQDGCCSVPAVLLLLLLLLLPLCLLLDAGVPLATSMLLLQAAVLLLLMVLRGALHYHHQLLQVLLHGLGLALRQQPLHVSGPKFSDKHRCDAECACASRSLPIGREKGFECSVACYAKLTSVNGSSQDGQGSACIARRRFTVQGPSH